MKFFIQQVYQEQIEIDIPRDTTLAQLRELLVSQYSYPDHQMKFINNGNILKDPGALHNVKELGRIIVHIKKKDSKKIHKKSKNKPKEEKNLNIENKSKNDIEPLQSRQDNANTEQENDIKLELSTNVDSKSSNDTKNNYNNSNENNIQYQDSFKFDNIPIIPFYRYLPLMKKKHSQSLLDMSKEQIDSYLSDCFKKIHLKQLYDEKCNFYANLSETKRIADTIEHNPGLILVVSQFTKENFIVAKQRNTINFDFAIELAGFVSSYPIGLADDYESLYEEMPTIHKQSVKRLMKKCVKTKREAVKALIDSDFEEKEAEKILQC